MGTRSIVGTPFGDGVRGRYCHWDGYPSGVGAALWAIIERDGVDKALFVLTEQHYGWSSLTAEAMPSVATYYRGVNRFVAVPGYGIGYTTEQGQTSADQWCQSPRGDGDDGGTEWGYAIGETALTVFELDWDGRPPTCRGVFRYADGEPDWDKMER